MRIWLITALIVVCAVGIADARTSPNHSGPAEPTRDSYADHYVGNVVFTVSDIGVQAYMDFPDNNVGSGFQYPSGAASILFEGALLIGTGPNMVSDAMRNADGDQDRDFAVSPGGDLVMYTPGAQADQQGYAMYDDGAADSPIGVQVEQHSYSWASAPDNDYIILRYVITNVGEGTISGMYVGIYLDWDVTAADNSNYDAANSVGYQYGSGSAYAGITSLSQIPPTTFRSILNPDEAYPPNPTEGAKWGWLTAGFTTTSHSGDDISMVMANGPYTLAPGEEAVVGFALVAGDDLGDLQQNTIAAQSMWMNVPVELTSFDAMSAGDHVELTWNTATESDTYGFNIYRALGLDANQAQINTQVIPGAGISAEPISYSFSDYGVSAGETYFYWLEEVALTGETALYGPASVTMVPDAHVLQVATPNPATESTVIRYALTHETPVDMVLYDLSGRTVRTLVNEIMPGGQHQITWDGTNDEGQLVSGGTYFCRLSTQESSQSIKITVIR